MRDDFCHAQDIETEILQNEYRLGRQVSLADSEERRRMMIATKEYLRISQLLPSLSGLLGVFIRLPLVIVSSVNNLPKTVHLAHGILLAKLP